MKRYLWMAVLLLVIASILYASNEYTSGDYRFIYTEDTSVSITEYLGNDRNVSVPSLLDNRPVVEMGGIGFGYNNDLQWISISASVKRINPYILIDCPSLQEIWFLGDAPSIYRKPNFGDPDAVTIRYLAGTSGFTNPWYGYRTVASSHVPPDYAHPMRTADGRWEFSLSGRNIVLT